MKYEYFFKNRDDAEEVLEGIKELLVIYGYVDKHDLCDLTGVIKQSSNEWKDAKYGWTDVSNAAIVSRPPLSDFILVLPEPCELSNTLIKPGNVDMINNPPHYQSETGLEVIDVIKAFTADLKGIQATDTGNVIKYICRWKNKNGIEDLKKIIWYTQHLINHLEKIEKENK